MPAKKVTSIAKAVAKKAAVPKTVAAQAAEAPVVGRLFTPTHVVRETKLSATAMPQVQPERVEVAAQRRCGADAGCGADAVADADACGGC